MLHNPDLTSSEIANLWNSFMVDSFNICIMKHFLSNVEDKEVEEILQHSKNLSTGHIQSFTSIFQKEGIPIPQGYTIADVNETAPRLYSDSFYLRFLQFMGRTGANLNGMALGTSYREDIRAYYLSSLNESGQLYDRIIELLEVKGLLTRTSYIAYPKEVEFVEDIHFLSGYLTLNKRALLAIEISHLSNNIEANFIGKTLIDGLAQVAKSKDVRKQLHEGYKLASEIVNTLEKTLEHNHTDSPFTADSATTESTVSPFSDKLIMALTSILTSISVNNFGQAIGASFRSDLIGEYTQLLAKVGKYATANAKLIINNGWMEKPPQSINRRKLKNEG